MVWIIPFVLIGLGIKIIRHIYHSSSQQFDKYDELEDQIYGRQTNMDNYSRHAPNDSTGARESQVFRLAHTMKGRLTLSDIVLELGVGLKEAEQIIEEMVDGVHIRMEVRDNGLVVYEFPEIIARFEGRDNLDN